MSYTNYRSFIGTGETVQKDHGDHLKLSENLDCSLPGFSIMNFCPTHVLNSVTHGIMLGRQGGKCMFRFRGSPSVKDVFGVLKFLK